MRLSHELLTVHPTHPFTIARSSTSEYQRVWVRICDNDGVEGWGEAAPNIYFGETADSVVGALRRYAPVVERADAWSIETLEMELERALHCNAAARAAISSALHDLAARRLGAPLYRLWGLEPARAPRSSFTIGIGDPDAIRAKVAAADEYPILKVKLGTDRDTEIMRTVREAAPGKVLRVDANAAWSAKHALGMIDLLAGMGVEYVEQPVPAHDLAALRFVRDRSALPIIADEACVVARDIPRLAECADGINIKLAKCGGLREALRMIATARSHGMRVMLGCMVETSLGISAAAHLAPLVDDADLDGAALLRDDPFVGATIAGGTISLPPGPGLGVARR